MQKTYYTTSSCL